MRAQNSICPVCFVSYLFGRCLSWVLKCLDGDCTNRLSCFCWYASFCICADHLKRVLASKPVTSSSVPRIARVCSTYRHDSRTYDRQMANVRSGDRSDPVLNSHCDSLQAHSSALLAILSGFHWYLHQSQHPLHSEYEIAVPFRQSGCAQHA